MIENFGEALPPRTQNKRKTPSLSGARNRHPATRTKKLRFDVRRRIGKSPTFYITKSRDPMAHPLRDDFPTAHSAFDFIKNHYEVLEELWVIHKAHINLSEQDIRKDKNTVTHTYHADIEITPYHMMSEFKPKGVEFGKWCTQQDRKEQLGYFYDALRHLELVTSRSTQDWCKDLGIAFGARGSGHAAAHYEPQHHIINLTKNQGAGCLAHELFHAFDDNTRQLPRIETFERRCRALDSVRSKRYWSTPREMRARAFEQWVKYRLHKPFDIVDDYLANILTLDQFARRKDPLLYPYLLDEELPIVDEFFTTLFSLRN